MYAKQIIRETSKHSDFSQVIESRLIYLIEQLAHYKLVTQIE